MNADLWWYNTQRSGHSKNILLKKPKNVVVISIRSSLRSESKSYFITMRSFLSFALCGEFTVIMILKLKYYRILKYQHEKKQHLLRIIRVLHILCNVLKYYLPTSYVFTNLFFFFFIVMYNISWFFSPQQSRSQITIINVLNTRNHVKSCSLFSRICFLFALCESFCVNTVLQRKIFQ